MPTMKSKPTFGFIAILAYVCLIGLSTANGGSPVPSQLIGTWDYTSLSVNAKGTGVADFHPGEWTVTFNQDATWVMKSPLTPGGDSGRYEVKGHDLTMLRTNGELYEKYRFSVSQNGKVLGLVSKLTTISASRE